MKFHFSSDITLACGQYESALKFHHAQGEGMTQCVASRSILQRSAT
jgi:hypothetical protein